MAGLAEDRQPARRRDAPAHLAFGVEIEADAAVVQNLGAGDGVGQVRAEGRQALVAKDFVGEQHILRRHRCAVGKRRLLAQGEDDVGLILG
jgi:hypothetical protein